MLTVTEQTIVDLPLSPPRRLLAPTRWRSFKTIQDRAVWDAAWARVQALVDEGWQIDRVIVDWGRSVPGVGEERARFLARLFPGLATEERMSASRRGTTSVYLRREHE